MSFSLIDMLGRACPRIDIVDVGAMWLDHEALPYHNLLKADTHVVGFEPDRAECDKLNLMKRRNQRFLPYFIGDGAVRTFHACNRTETGSLYEPDLPLVSRFHDLAEIMTLAGTSPVQTRRLDDLPDVAGMDYLKVDVQGAELDVLKGAVSRLKTCLVVHAEVEFVPIYKDQPLFADVDAFLRSHGFLVHSLGPMMYSRTFKPFIPGGPAPISPQLLWTDAVFVKSFMRFAELSPDQLLKLAVILHDQYNACDLAALALQHHEAKTGKGLWKIYTTRLNRGVTPTAPPLSFT